MNISFSQEICFVVVVVKFGNANKINNQRFFCSVGFFWYVLVVVLICKNFLLKINIGFHFCHSVKFIFYPNFYCFSCIFFNTVITIRFFIQKKKNNSPDLTIYFGGIFFEFQIHSYEKKKLTLSSGWFTIGLKSTDFLLFSIFFFHFFANRYLQLQELKRTKTNKNLFDDWKWFEMTIFDKFHISVVNVLLLGLEAKHLEIHIF